MNRQLTTKKEQVAMNKRFGFIKTDSGWVFRVNEPTEFTRRYETAAWYSTVLVQPGDYPATFTNIVGDRVDGPDAALYARAELAGRTTYDHFPTLFGGVQVNDVASRERDEPSMVSVETYAFTLR